MSKSIDCKNRKFISCTTIALLLSLISVSISQHAVVAQISKKYVPYKNAKLGFSILYPSDWHAQGTPLPSQIDFDSPDNATISIIVSNASKYLDTNTLTLKTRTPHDFALDQIKINSALSITKDIRDMPVTVGTAHIPGWRLDDMFLGSQLGSKDSYTIFTYAVANGKEYKFVYDDDPLKVPETLPIMQTMLNSFQVIK